ncbi:EBNA-1 nuclear protein [Enterovibrio norvegicus]|uniref:DUF1611 domain-containing protein n=1 Tax=Enterovibrio norvegicus TaxID=188144 RepID=UPI000C83C04C|nr:DUF1611 domain-containing protein [Enterovibrio norvegicus]MCC4796906.1 DUF1611 domain-containing protein [Enterovibrio norvegicus]PMH62028.1 EBNA-1 nuclear protein [Enterovibrio norvegicus]PMI32577.1 EBNA-1 nuclear protein [Enterovibrio norvegicus]PMI36398.1 EBNA-1 nuclear protein [Enterovibrio norvegicus]PMN53879.1 EBNA-1 nuclear protein [Enterovibrio norvegicus]
MTTLPSSQIDTLDLQLHKPFSKLYLLQSGFESLPTAIVYCEANFGKIDGKTANGLIRHSPNFRILSVIDSEKSGLDTGYILDGECNGIPVCASLKDSIENAGGIPDYFIFGLAPSGGLYSEEEKSLILYAMRLGMNIVNGLHEFLNEDPEFISAAETLNVTILDIRKPHNKKDLQTFSGVIHQVCCPRILVAGTDCAIGKRTTATILADALRECGLNVVFIATGQTGVMQGARYAVVMDAVPSQFCAGELESLIVGAYETEQPDVIIIEGQGALSHPAFTTSAGILRGCAPHGVILQHAPKRLHRTDFENMPMPSVRSEIDLINGFGNVPVMGITLNHEGMSSHDIAETVKEYHKEFELPVTDALSLPAERLCQMVFNTFPALNKQLPIITP